MDFQWNENGVCTNADVVKSTKDKNNYYKGAEIEVGKHPSGVWCWGHDINATNWGSASPCSLAGGRRAFPTKDEAIEDAISHVMDRIEDRELCQQIDDFVKWADYERFQTQLF
ncbi:hypothetical protein [Fodinibius sp. SL11]|uniref:hypothetical protein n=1 Tax=Fodinibius sp. SL11 TaxID=3425690 RepID=UPI003F88433A